MHVGVVVDSADAIMTTQQGGVIFTFFSIFENGHLAIDCLYFYELITKKSANFAAHAAKFSFSKNHRDLENEYFWKTSRKLPETFLLHKRTIVKNRICLVGTGIYFILQKWRKWFLTYK